MIVASIRSVKANLSKLIRQAEAGEDVVIARNGKLAVRLTPLTTAVNLAERRADGLPAWMGSVRGEIMVGEGFEDYDTKIEALFADTVRKP